MLESEDSVSAEVRILNLPDLACFSSFKELLLSLPNWLSVLVPNSITNVIVSNTEPNDTQRNFIWFKRNNAGSVVGIYLFSNGTWNQFFPVPGQVTTVTGNSNNPPPGWITTEDAVTLTASQKAYFKALWHDNGGGGYDIYTVVPDGQ